MGAFSQVGGLVAELTLTYHDLRHFLNCAIVLPTLRQNVADFVEWSVFDATDTKAPRIAVADPVGLFVGKAQTPAPRVSV